MKQIGLFLLLVTIVSATTSQTKKQQDEQKVNNTISRFFDGISSLDFGLMRHTSTSDLVILESGAIWNMDSIVKRLEPLQKMEYKRANELKFIRTEVQGNSGWVFYDNRARISVNGKERNAHWLESAVLVKTGNDWKITLLHSTSIQPQQ